MTSERYVVAGLAHARSAWFPRLAQWSTGGLVPVEFAQCLSASELQSRLDGSRPFSAALIDGDLPGVDRDLLEDLTRHGVTPIIVVRPGSPGSRWFDLGAVGLLEPDFTHAELLAALAQHARPVSRVADIPTTFDPTTFADTSRATGRLVAFTGPGGTGSSVLAAAAASGLSGDVLLADLSLRADQAMYHHTRDVIPGVQELVEAHRTGHLPADELVGLTFDIGRPYRLLLGLRRTRDWTAIRPRAFERALANLLLTWDVVVADVDSALDGEADTGSADVDDRHLMARTTVRRADLVVVVGRSGLRGVHATARIISDVIDAGVPAGRIVPVVNQAARHPRARAEAAAALAALCAASPGGHLIPSPVFVPAQRGLERVLRDCASLPGPLVEAISKPVKALLDQASTSTEPGRGDLEPVPIAPGSLGAWPDGATDRGPTA